MGHAYTLPVNIKHIVHNHYDNNNDTGKFEACNRVIINRTIYAKSDETHY